MWLKNLEMQWALNSKKVFHCNDQKLNFGGTKPLNTCFKIMYFIKLISCGTTIFHIISYFIFSVLLSFLKTESFIRLDDEKSILTLLTAYHLHLPQICLIINISPLPPSRIYPRVFSYNLIKSIGYSQAIYEVNFFYVWVIKPFEGSNKRGRGGFYSYSLSHSLSLSLSLSLFYMISVII